MSRIEAAFWRWISSLGEGGPSLNVLAALLLLHTVFFYSSSAARSSSASRFISARRFSSASLRKKQNALLFQVVLVFVPSVSCV